MDTTPLHSTAHLFAMMSPMYGHSTAPAGTSTEQRTPQPLPGVLKTCKQQSMCSTGRSVLSEKHMMPVQSRAQHSTRQTHRLESHTVLHSMAQHRGRYIEILGKGRPFSCQLCLTSKGYRMPACSTVLPYSSSSSTSSSSISVTVYNSVSSTSSITSSKAASVQVCQCQQCIQALCQAHSI
jgi:hypothetical protein